MAVKDKNNKTIEIFKESNIVSEEISEMILDSNGIYRLNTRQNVEGLIKDVQDFEDANVIAENNSDAKEVKEIDNAATIDKITTMFKSVNDLDEFGHLIYEGPTCPVCGKKVKFMPPNGFCSIECFAKDLASKILTSTEGEYCDFSLDIIDKIQNVLNMTSTVLNIITKLPDLLGNLSKIPDEYRDYVTLIINQSFVRLKIIVDKLLIKKNNLIIKLLSSVKFGVIDDKIAPMFEAINTILLVVDLLKVALNTAVEAILAMMQNPVFGVPPQSYGFFMTPKSFFYPMTSGKFMILIPHDNSLVNVLGMATLISAGFGASALSNINYELIDKIIRSIFLPITEVEYLLDPEVFKVRLALSDLNIPVIKKFIELIENFTVMGGDYLPRYLKLKLTNPWFVVAILCGWGPVTKAIFGDYIPCYHATL